MDRPLDESSGDLLDDLLDRWEDARQQGCDLSIEEICQDHPELRDEFARQVAKLQAMDRRMAIDDPGEEVPESLQTETQIEGLKFLQRGGLGSVYVGEDSTAHRRVAVKFLHPHLAIDPMCRERFELEAEVTGRLEHPGVIPLYGTGRQPGGQPFYCMRFIDGRSMDEMISELFDDERHGKIASVELDRRYRQLLGHFVSVCQTIAYAHNRGIVHRDLKPANIMLGKYGETIVVDWGLAVPVVREETFRQSGEKTLMPVPDGDSSSGGGGGTPVYMSPEQASNLAPTPASDIYSLGGTLFKIVCGCPAVTGETAVEIRSKVIDGRIDTADQTRPRVPPPLASIVAKAMSLRPRERYLTAMELAEDVDAYLADDKVTAHQEPWYARMLRLGRKHRAATQTVVLSSAVLAIASVLGFLTLGAYAARETKLRKTSQRLQQAATSASEAARASRDEALQVSAKYSAKSIANDIDLRWRILESIASSPVPRRLIQQLNREIERKLSEEGSNVSATERLSLKALDPAATELQAYLQAMFIRQSDAVAFDSISAQSIHGYQVARVPMSTTSMGRNYRHRDYFHGLGRDLTPDELAGAASPPLPLTKGLPHMATVYESTSTGTLKTAFSVPVFDEDDSESPIGLISMSVELGHFATDRHIWLIDTRVSPLIEDRGLVLQHPDYGTRSREDELPRIAAETLQRMMDAATDRTAADSNRIGDMRTNRRDEAGPEGGGLMNVADPLSGEVRRVAIEPVMVSGREAALANTGWMVVIAE